MGRIKRYVARWTEGIIAFIIGVIILLPLTWLLNWVERTPSGQWTWSCCLILFIFVASFSYYPENHDIIEEE